MDSFYGSNDANRTGGWHPEPTFRGTFGILSSCIITMALCIWTAVHLNIPAHGEKGFITPQMWRKLFWLIVGLFAPKVIAWIAFVQRRTALDIHQEMADRVGQAGESRENEESSRIAKVRRHIQRFFYTKPVQFDNGTEWTIVHSHYAADL